MLVRHSLIYVMGRLLPGLVGVTTTAALTRILSPTEYGRYGLTLVMMAFGSTVFFDWLGVSFLRFYQARQDDPSVISTVIQIFLALMIATTLFAILLWLFGFSASANGPIFVASVLMTWGYSWFELVARFEIANFRPGRFLAMNLTRAALILAGTVLGAVLSDSAVWTALGAAGGMLAGAFTGDLRRWRISRTSFDPVFARTLLVFGAPIAASLAMNSLIFSGTRGLLDVLGSARELGYYTAAFVLIQNALTAVAGGIVAAGYSLAVRAVEAGDAVLVRDQLEANGALLLAVMSPIALGISLTAPGMTRMFLGADFAEHVARITPWMAAGTFLWCIRSHHLDHAFQLGRRSGLQVRVTGLAAIMSLGLSVLLIPREGAAGVAMAITAAMATACVHAWLEGLRAYPIPLPVGAFIRVGVACAAMTVAVCSIAGTTGLGFALQVTAGAATYTLVGIATNILGSRDVLSAKMRDWRARGLPVIAESD